MLDPLLIELEENRIRDAVGELPSETRKQYYQLLRGRTRDPDTYAVLNWFMVAGLHHFYLGKIFRGMVNLAVFILGLVFLFILPLLGIALIAAVLIVELWALFRSQYIVRDFNNQVSAEVLAEVRMP